VVDVASGKLFPGQYYDQETQLHYNYFRDYDASLGRYTQSDPIGLNGGLNTYLYAQANSLKYIDVNGLFGVAFVQGGRVLLGGLIGGAAVNGLQGTQDALENSGDDNIIPGPWPDQPGPKPDDIQDDDFITDDDVMDTCIEWKLSLKIRKAELEKDGVCPDEVEKQFMNNQIKNYNSACGSISGRLSRMK